MKSAGRSDTDFEATMQFARWIINVGLTPCDDDATFDNDVLQFTGIEPTKGDAQIAPSR